MASALTPSAKAMMLNRTRRTVCRARTISAIASASAPAYTAASRQIGGAAANEAHVRSGESGSVVDAVAHHQHFSQPCGSSCSRSGLSSGSRSRRHAHCRCQRARRWPRDDAIVARQQVDVFHAWLSATAAAASHVACPSDQSLPRPCRRQRYVGITRPAAPATRPSTSAVCQAPLAQEGDAADVHPVLYTALCPAPPRRKGFGRGQIEPRRVASATAPKGVFRAVRRRRESQQFFRAEARRRNDRCDRGPALGQRADLVEPPRSRC